MKHFLVAFLLPMTLTAQDMRQLTEQLGKTVLYGHVALSPDGAHLAWVQSTAATTSKQTCIRENSGKTPAKLVMLPTPGERTDFDPAWSPDSKTLAFFSSAGERDQRQLWTVKSDASDAKKITKLNGYAARPRWSHDGKQIAFLYIEGAGGGGPLMAAPATTGVIDTAIHNQRIAVLDIGNGQLRQVSLEDLHIYDYDWSPDDKMFVATAAPGPGDNNWWIAQIFTVDSVKGNATSIYKPWFQVAVPRWSPDGKSIAYFSDKTGEYELTIRSADYKGSEETITKLGPGYRYQPYWSPDSRKVFQPAIGSDIGLALKVPHRHGRFAPAIPSQRRESVDR